MAERAYGTRARIAVAVTLALAVTAIAAQTPLPTGFGPVALGTTWDQVQAVGRPIELIRPASEWERLMRSCGYRSARLTAEQGNLLVTTHDFTVTELSYAEPLRPGSDVMAAADQVIRTYGQPGRTTFRDELGGVTRDRSRAVYVVLDYEGPVQARFTVSGEPLWEYRVSIADPARRRLENRTARCARERESGPG